MQCILRLRLLLTPLLLCLGLLVVSACAPFSQTYLRIDAPDATYHKPECGGGPKTTAYYPFHGVFISVDITHWIRMALHLPQGTTAELLGRTITIEGHTDDGPIHFTTAIAPASVGSFGSPGSPIFRRIDEEQLHPDPTNLGPFQGRSKGDQIIWYSFAAWEVPGRRHLSAPKGLKNGYIELPALRVNGRRFEAQRLPFQRELWRGFVPINC